MKKDRPSKTYNFESIGTDITLDIDAKVNPGVEVSSAIGCDEADPVQKAVAHGVLLAVTAFAAEGMHDILEHPKFEHCVKSALERVPPLAQMMSTDS